MNMKFQFTIALILCLLSLVGFCFMALLISRQEIIRFDSAVISFIQGFESTILTIIMKAFTFIGSTGSIIVISIMALVIFYKVFKKRSELILFIVVLLGANLLFVILKLFFQRARPDLHRLIEVAGYSFPSGHATNAMAVYGILSFLLWRHIPARWGRTILIFISCIFILMIGISRIYLGVHYPSDIIAGYFTGGFSLTFAIWFYQRYEEKRYNQKHINEN
ncbi:phosphatase PAP2 family protein [Metabacillus fastidiosus]|uniref:phosphatase PAP2 family protein n=1 Tax=Metabacillus fastidiosus TaxID=1458 RepID=UPI003D299499